jgi:hypothetical protein
MEASMKDVTAMTGALFEIAPYVGIAGGLILLTLGLYMWKSSAKNTTAPAIMILIGVYPTTLGVAQILARRGLVSPEVYGVIAWLLAVLVGATAVYGMIKGRKERMEFKPQT